MSMLMSGQWPYNLLPHSVITPDPQLVLISKTPFEKQIILGNLITV